jgi:hypothetical protein
VLLPAQRGDIDMLASAMSSLKASDKYVKINLLTPFGIVIDAFMVADKNGNSCLLDSHAGHKENEDEFFK